MNKIILSFFALVSLCHPLQAAFSGPKFNEPKIIVNNRILARVNGKNISTYDVMKKMDMSFFKLFPEYVSSTQARFQYYEYSWPNTLSDMINKELILADAKEHKVEVSNGDVRQELEATYGPNLIANLDKMGLSYDDAFKIVQGDIILRRMIAGRVNNKAIRVVTPAKVRQSYEEYVQNPDHARSTTWEYQVVTVKERTTEKTQEAAQKVFQLLEDGTALDQLVAQAKEQRLIGRKGQINVSAPIKNNEREIGKTYLSFLEELKPGAYSQPFAHKSRSDNSTAYRILFLKEKVPGGYPTYKEIEGSLKDDLLNQEADKETDLYLERLKDHFHLRDEELESMAPQDYQPFLLK